MGWETERQKPDKTDESDPKDKVVDMSAKEILKWIMGQDAKSVNIDSTT